MGAPPASGRVGPSSGLGHLLNWFRFIVPKACSLVQFDISVYLHGVQARLRTKKGDHTTVHLPLSVVLAEANDDTLIRHLTLFDLVVVGVAGTLGTGIFAIVGLIGNSYAGPAGIVSWVLAGIGCCFSGLSYAELSSVIPSEGGAYAYAFVALGELPAVITAWCLTLEFGVSGAAVARVWADKILEWVLLWEDSSAGHFWAMVFDPIPKLGVSPLAAILQAIWVVVLLRGVALGKRVTTILTAVKMAVCVFIIIAGFSVFHAENLIPFAPMGVSGVIRGSSAAFFGYLGYDEVCAMAGESVNPRRDVPLSIAYILGIVALTYALSALALSGMVPIDGSPLGASFVLAFAERGLAWASQIVAIGELVSLPVVVLASFLVQPRLLFVLATDGLLPKSLASTDQKGVLRNATILSGAIMIVIAGVAPFAALDDFISAGVLLSFAITNSCAIVVRRSNLDPVLPGPCRPLVLLTNALCFMGGIFVRLVSSTPEDRPAARMTAAAAAGLVFMGVGGVTLAVVLWCPELPHPHGGNQAFRAPLSPWVPSVGICISWILLAQLSWASLRWTLWGLIAVIISYFVYGVHHSVGQKSRTWPSLAAAVAIAASDTSMGSPLASPRYFATRSAQTRFVGQGSRRPNLRATFVGEPPLESSPVRGGESDEHILTSSHQDEGYMSFATLT